MNLTYSILVSILIATSSTSKATDENLSETTDAAVVTPGGPGACIPSQASRTLGQCPRMKPHSTSIIGGCSITYSCGSPCHPVGGINPYIVSGDCHAPTIGSPNTLYPGTCVDPRMPPGTSKSCIP